MKKSVVFLLAVILLINMAACRSPAPAGQENSSGETGKTEIELPQPVDYGVQYIRTDGYQEAMRYPAVDVICSTDELNTYYLLYSTVYDLERRQQVYSDTTVGFLDACDRYDAAFFEENCLVFVLLEEGSGSIRHRVSGCTVSPEGLLGVRIDTLIPELGTDDMAQWHIILELSNTVGIGDMGSVQVWLDGKLAFDGTQLSPEKNGSILKVPPNALLYHPDGTAALLASGYFWMYPDRDGTMTGCKADALHPLDCKDILTPIYVNADCAQLRFYGIPDAASRAQLAAEPDSIRIRCWPDSVWNTNVAYETTPYETVACKDGTFTPEPGGYIYEIIANWNEQDNTCYGTAHYYAYIVRS